MEASYTKSRDYCEHESQRFVRTPELIHYGKYVCSDCGKFISWKKKPKENDCMAYLNDVKLIGRLVRDPETKQIPSGHTVCDFSIAVSRKYNGKEEVGYFDCQAWAKTAEIIQQYCKKGSQVLVGGRLRQEAWDDKKTGAQRSRITVVVSDVQFMDASKQQQERKPQAASSIAAGAGNGAGGFYQEWPQDEPPF